MLACPAYSSPIRASVNRATRERPRSCEDRVAAPAPQRTDFVRLRRRVTSANRCHLSAPRRRSSVFVGEQSRDDVDLGAQAQRGCLLDAPARERPAKKQRPTAWMACTRDSVRRCWTSAFGGLVRSPGSAVVCRIRSVPRPPSIRSTTPDDPSRSPQPHATRIASAPEPSTGSRAMARLASGSAVHATPGRFSARPRSASPQCPPMRRPAPHRDLRLPRACCAALPLGCAASRHSS